LTLIVGGSRGFVNRLTALAIMCIQQPGKVSESTLVMK
jgi:hypothetical protein